jgi:hypothetical protein
MKTNDIYTDLKGKLWKLSELSSDEQDLLAELFEYAQQCGDWTNYRNHWMAEVNRFFATRGMNRQEMQQTAVYRIAQDVGSRMAVSAGVARTTDYRDELENIIRTRFRTRREFCEATGLSEDMLSHVLARRKHLAINTLSEALEKVGYTIHITPLVR